jgi:hypothetical protein
VVTELHPRQEGRSFVVLELLAENQNGLKVLVGKANVRLP